MDYYIVNGELYRQDELAHHGIKGQRWGIRRTAEQLGHVIKRRKAKKAAAKKAAEEEAAKKKAAEEASRPKKVSEMSDEEINAAINRMNLEKRYNDTVKSVTPKEDTKSKNETKPPVDVSKKKSVSEMSDEEINAAINRMNLEKRYKDAMATPEQKSAGTVVKEFIKTNGKKVIDDVIVPAATDAAKQAFKSFLVQKINDVQVEKGIPEEYRVYTNNKKK